MMNGTVYPSAKISQRTMLEMDTGTRIGDFSFIGCSQLVMQENACINRFCELQGRGKITLARNAQVCSHATIATSIDTPWGSMCDGADPALRRIKTADVYIGEEASIGPYVSIMPGVTIGKGAVIGAYCYISSDVRPGVILHPRTTMVEKERRFDKGLRGYFERIGLYGRGESEVIMEYESQTYTRDHYPSVDDE